MRKLKQHIVVAQYGKGNPMVLGTLNDGVLAASMATRHANDAVTAYLNGAADSLPVIKIYTLSPAQLTAQPSEMFARHTRNSLT